ncbi:hypothetical protein WG66_010192 [Moniliophthora roreri]|uniref:Enoyl reductase (ER) domain-containing protein n=1 Tax=Moniliophthora roreri TaxID=221103 RepID=A0A0W0FMI2_MONRR|nr:hypothetical protein WG66_010192 [Moniliophthora roreri]
MSLPTSTREFYYPKFGSYTDLKLRESTLPSELKSSQVLVKIHAVSLQFRDLMISHGQYSAPTPEYLVPCSDMAGDVIAIGSEVSEWKTGDRVCANLLPDHLYGDPSPQSVSAALGGGVNGVLTQFKIFKSTVLVAIPEHLSYEEASTLPCAALTAYNALHGPIPIRGGDTILVQGTGGVSIFALQFAVACGATVILTSSSDEKLELVPDWEKEVMKITKGRGVDHTIEVGGPGTFAKSMQSTRFGGWIHIIGVLAMDSEETSSTNFIISAIWRGLNFRGIQVGSVELFKVMNRLIETHPDVTRPVVDKVFSFENSIKAFEYLESQVHVGKVVIKVA